jgi:excisionase family DNA binding protein
MLYPKFRIVRADGGGCDMEQAPAAGVLAAKEPPLLLKAEEAARLLGLGRSTVFGMLASGELPAVRYGRAVRVRRSDLEAWIERQIRESDRIATVG